MDPNRFVDILTKLKKINEEFEKEFEKGTESQKKYPKPLDINYTMSGNFKGFLIYEGDDLDQIKKLVDSRIPEVKFQFLPIIETGF
ncbi:MAG: hypothetical protein ACXAC7_11320 [Candidatus Hodarchaeales archaeon]|jgi:hypothetical protein